MTEQEQAELIETLRSVFGRGKRCGTLADTFRCAVSGALDAKEEIHTLRAQNARLIEALRPFAMSVGDDGCDMALRAWNSRGRRCGAVELAQIVALRAMGLSLSAASRVTGVPRQTITNSLKRVGAYP